MKVFPAINIVPTRAWPLLLTDTEKVITPLPVALLLDVIVIQLALLLADQPHPVPAVTLTLPAPPLLPNVLIVGEIVNVQPPFAPD